MTPFYCACGNALFFENSHCLRCQRPVGYDPALDRMVPIEEGWTLCANGTQYGICNWLVRLEQKGTLLCASCQYTRVVADLTVPGNLQAWHRLENAKRRVLHTLFQLGLRPQPMTASEDGLAFDFLAPIGGQRITTGHSNGVITLNIHEANDAYRENERQALNEPYRTLIGHFRHELGHYYWDRFFRNASESRIIAFRNLFGDERAEYAASLQRYYQSGGANGGGFITSYAAAHPWEDWAETWAQYLHLTDALETTRAYGWESDRVPLPFNPLESDAVFGNEMPADRGFLDDVNAWAKITPALNEIAATLGHPNLYPFVFSTGIVRKMAFVHEIIKAYAADQTAR